MIYSGNHKEVVESIPVGKCRFLTGMNDYMMSYLVKPNEHFESVEAIFVYANSLDDIKLEITSYGNYDVYLFRLKILHLAQPEQILLLLRLTSPVCWHKQSPSTTTFP